ncbi:DnaD domain-containing protein [Macrococcoides bohemicum]|uniref:DNA replication protein DnaD n=1 Tax=Macrococcoides bohemicum TaxID=1903056 RepID=A0A328A6L2_9STAP|nr:DnaD domain protein [Macrococcus bohemicus]RAK50183.1 DNA replication protein DnaD [Macrococcus bohemicus]
MAGWIKVHRQLMDSPIFDNEKLFKVFMYCLMKASHKEHKQLVGKQVVILKPGQFVFGRKKASAEANMSASTLWSYMLTLKNLDTIDIKSNNKFSVVTIVNWGLYQQEEENHDSKRNNKRTTDEQQTNNKRTTDEQQMDTNKNVKNVKNVENDNNEKNVRSSSNNDDFKTVVSMYQENIELNPAPVTFQKIQQDFNDYGKDIMLYAIKKSALKNNHNYSFINYLLNDWKKKQLITVDEIKQSEHNFEFKKQSTYSKQSQSKEITPEWINQEYVEPERTPEEEARLEEERRRVKAELENLWKE